MEVHICNLSRTEPGILKGELKLCHFACDLGVPAEIERAAAAVESWLSREVPAGRVLLINNSGFGSYGSFPEPNLRHQLEIIDVNVRGLVDLTGKLLPTLKRRGGAVMNVASTAAFQPTPFMATYGASKAFVLNWSLAMNEELRGSGVRVMAVCPGPTATNFHRRAGLKDRSERSRADSSSMTSEAVAGEALQALGARKPLVATGWKNKLTAAAASLVPKALAARIAARVIERYRVRRDAP